MAALFSPNSVQDFVVAQSQGYQAIANIPAAERRYALRTKIPAGLSVVDQAVIARLAGAAPPADVAEHLLCMVPSVGPFPVTVRLEDLAWDFGWVSVVLEKPEGAKLLGFEQHPAILECQQRRASATLAVRWRYQSASLFAGQNQQNAHVHRTKPSMAMDMEEYAMDLYPKICLRLKVEISSLVIPMAGRIMM